MTSIPYLEVRNSIIPPTKRALFARAIHIGIQAPSRSHNSAFSPSPNSFELVARESGDSHELSSVRPGSQRARAPVPVPSRGAPTPSWQIEKHPSPQKRSPPRPALPSACALSDPQEVSRTLVYTLPDTNTSSGGELLDVRHRIEICDG